MRLPVKCINLEFDKWSKLVNEEPPDTLWKISTGKELSIKVQASNEELVVHFENLYACNDPEEENRIKELVSHHYVAPLDDPISKDEIDKGRK